MSVNKNVEINKGWESYYLNSHDGDLWKDDVEPFLIENYSKITNDKKVKILDIGCGDGRNSFIWIENNHEIDCLDVAQTCLKKIEEKCKVNALKIPKLLCENFLESSSKNEVYDVVQCFDALAQINDVNKAFEMLCKMAKKGGYIIFNYFTPGDCAYGEGTKIDDNTFAYKDTLFKFLSEAEVVQRLPDNVEVIIKETRRWDDPPHGEYRPYRHTHEAAFFLLRKK